jgi:hypothetical protein
MGYYVSTFKRTIDRVALRPRQYRGKDQVDNMAGTLAIPLIAKEKANDPDLQYFTLPEPILLPGKTGMNILTEEFLQLFERCALPLPVKIEGEFMMTEGEKLYYFFSQDHYSDTQFWEATTEQFKTHLTSVLQSRAENVELLEAHCNTILNWGDTLISIPFIQAVQSALQGEKFAYESYSSYDCHTAINIMRRHGWVFQR